MHPILFKIGPLTIYTYGVFVAAAFLVSITLFLSQAEKEGLERKRMIDLCLLITVGSIAGARIFHLLSHPHFYLEHPLDLLKIWQGGLIFYGGLTFALVVSLWFTNHYGVPFWKIANTAAPPLALGISIGRIGCFFNGCCYGRPWSWGFIFPPYSPAGEVFPDQPLIPAQLISSLNLLIIFSLLIIFRKRRGLFQPIFLWFLALYSLHRFVVEFIRADYPKIFFSLTVPQFMSIILGFSALALMHSFKGR